MKIRGKIQPNWPLMSRFANSPAIQVKRRERHLELLRKGAVEPGVRIHCEGGMAFKGDVASLVRMGLMKIVRVPYGRGWGGDYQLRRTFAVTTDKGKTLILQTKPLSSASTIAS